MRDRIVALSGTMANMTGRQLTSTLVRKSKSAIFARTDIFERDTYKSIEQPEGVTFDPIRSTTEIVKLSLDTSYSEFLQKRLSLLNEGTISFLNRSINVDNELPERIHPTVGEEANFPRFWTLKLLSLEPVNWLALTSGSNVNRYTDTILNWLTEWDQTQYTTIHSPGYRRRYWASYTVSRRIWNLGLLGSLFKEDKSAHNRISCRLSQNLQFLSDHVEYDVGGNHVAENAFALIFGGSILQDEDLISEGLEILTKGLESQLLDDGMHYERSPMYHSILLFRGAWSLGVLEQAGYEIPQKVTQLFQSMYYALFRLAPGNANFPLLNDSVFQESPSRETCLELSERLFGFERPADRMLAGESGYYSVFSDDMMAIIDGGKPGPPHLPGHSHNDIGNLIVWLGENPILTDTGTYDYQSGERRTYSRSVSAHNTVQADDSDQTVTHGRFKMGPRPNIAATREEDGTVQVSFESPAFVTNYCHKRRIQPIAGGIRITDSLRGNATTYTARFHISPNIDVDTSRTRATLRLSNGTILTLDISGIDELMLTKSEFYPEYGVAIRRPCLKATLRNRKNKTSQINTILSLTDESRIA